MKTKNYLYKIAMLLVLISSHLAHSQRPGRVFDEFLIFDDFGDIRSDNNNNNGANDVENFSLNWDSNFDTALTNLINLERAKKDNIMAWYREQHDLIEEEIERQLNRDFGSYNEAKKAYFIHIENRNIDRAIPQIRPRYSALRSSGLSKNATYLKELKALEIRKAEIRAGNIHHSQFPFLEASGVPLKDITTLNSLAQYRNNIENAFANMSWRIHEYKYIIEKLDYLGSAFEEDMLENKQNYYGDFSDWDRLGLMQFIIHLEHFKDTNCGVCSLPNGFEQFGNPNMATVPVIEDYAKANRGGGLSLFDPRYPYEYPHQYQNNFCGGSINLMAWEADKKAALDAAYFKLNNRTAIYSYETVDANNNPIGGEDTTVYPDFNPMQQVWPSINSVIPVTDFIGWNHPGVNKNCMDYAKAQIAKKEYQISNYFNSSSQTIQIYKSSTGVNQAELKRGLSYLKYALENGIPVIVGVDAKAGSPNPYTDNSTDHFVVIVGMGSDSIGNYFTFYDNASGKNPYENYGASPHNKLYYNSITGKITGSSRTPFSQNSSYPYIVTQIRKSKPL